MNIPNSLSILRILSIPVFINLLVYGYEGWALGVFLAAAVTDGLDGFIARVTHQRTRLGSYLDPIADKLLLTASFLTLGILHIIPVWSAVIFVSRDLILVLGALILYWNQSPQEMVPTFLGKCTTAIQLLFVLLILGMPFSQMGGPAFFPFLLFTIGLSVISGLHYIYRGIRHLDSASLIRS